MQPLETLKYDPTPVLFSLSVALGGLLLGWLVYGPIRNAARFSDPVENLGGVFTFLHRRWMWDELYRAIFIKPLQWIADNYSRLIDKGILDAILEGIYNLGGWLAGLFKRFDKSVITGFSDWVGRAFKGFGAYGRELQTGQVQGYLLSGLAMIVIIVAAFVLVFN